MKTITLTVFDMERFDSIQKKLSQGKNLQQIDKDYLSNFLCQISVAHTLALDKDPLEQFEISIWDMDKIETNLNLWKNLFGNLPGYDYVGCSFAQEWDKSMSNTNILMVVDFAPSLSFNLSRLDGFLIYLYADYTAKFTLQSLEDMEKYPGLFNFKGTWKEAYLVLIETLKTGWPIEEFPDELKQLLKQ